MLRSPVSGEPVYAGTAVRDACYLTFIRLVRTPCRPEGLSLAVQQKIHHALRGEATGINPESNVRQAIEAPLDDGLKLVDRPAGGRGLDTGGERRGLGVIWLAVAVRQVRGFFGQPVDPALP